MNRPEDYDLGFSFQPFFCLWVQLLVAGISLKHGLLTSFSHSLAWVAFPGMLEQ